MCSYDNISVYKHISPNNGRWVVIKRHDTNLYWSVPISQMADYVTDFLSEPEMGWEEDETVGEYICSLQEFKDSNPEYFI